MARGGKPDVTLEYVRLTSGEKVGLRGSQDISGAGTPERGQAQLWRRPLRSWRRRRRCCEFGALCCQKTKCIEFLRWPLTPAGGRVSKCILSSLLADIETAQRSNRRFLNLVSVEVERGRL